MPSTSTAPSASVDMPSTRMRFPELRLPTFSGKRTEWVNFRDNFRSLVHDNAQLNEIDKFNYLRSSLTGEALAQISALNVTAANYGVAWEALKRKFANKKLIAFDHLKAVFALTPLKTESYSGLNNLLSVFRTNLQQLEKLGERPHEWSTMLVFMLTQRLDSDTLRAWETHHASDAIPKYDAMVDFLERHCAILQSSESREGGDNRRFFRGSTVHSVTAGGLNCVVCNRGSHAVENCFQFRRMRIIERKALVRRLGLCLMCLLPGHFLADCTRSSCGKCGQRHHGMLHPPSSSSQSTSLGDRRTQRPLVSALPNHTQPANSLAQGRDNANNIESRQPPPTLSPSFSHHTATLPTPLQVNNALLSTAIVKLQDRWGNTVHARALLDNGSQICIITESLAQRLDFLRRKENLPVRGVGGAITVSKQSVFAKVLSCSSAFCSPELQFFVLPTITLSLPQQTIAIDSWNLDPTLDLADPRFYFSRGVDLVLGVQIFYDLLLPERRVIFEGGPVLQQTQLGWIVAGNAPACTNVLCAAVTISTQDVLEQLTRFWELETCRTKSCLSVEESTCEKYFEETTTIDQEGKFCVKLPLKQFMLTQLGSSRAIATKRFLSLERRLNSNAAMKEEYRSFMNEYVSMGHMKEITPTEPEPEAAYYLPHHAVVKPDSTTTKLRVVFDASCASDTGLSLNDVLMTGPVVQDDLLAILLRFRLSKIAVIADVEKMYRMVKVHPSNQPLQRIIWRENPRDELHIFQLQTVTYGTASAPYLATRCLKKCAEDGRERFPAAAQIVENNFYVDDMLMGAQTIEEGVKLCEETMHLLAERGFNLRKWNSNESRVLEKLPMHLRADSNLYELDKKATVKTLGLCWDPLTDRFLMKTPSWPTSVEITQRTVLADSARLFDPYGFVSPVIVEVKMLLQELWKAKYAWDEPLKKEHRERWLELKSNLESLNQISVPRWICFGVDVTEAEIHGFCDASEKAYGAVVYVRCVRNDGEISIRLVMAKSRVAPLEDLRRKKRKATIPRLELSSALLLAHLYETVEKSLMMSLKAYFWTDSTIVKCWLSSHPSRWQAFVANRVSEIQHLTREGEWNHVPGLENPADIVSRGVSAAKLIDLNLWWNGPEWLRLDQRHWPKSSKHSEQGFDANLLEEKAVISAAIQPLPYSEIFSIHSSLLKLVRLVARLCRFANNCRVKDKSWRKIGLLLAEDHEKALNVLLKQAQSESFPLELAHLGAKGCVRRSSRLAAMNPTMRNGLICVGGRLEHASASASRKNPVIVDSKHPLTKLILIDYHHRLMHAGATLMISCARERYWPISARNLAKRVVHECVTCFRANPKMQQQLMGELPPERVTPADTFVRVGIDYCGPFNIRYPGRKATSFKCFVCVFVCLVVKAVHVELVMDLTTDAFLAALSRFVDHRGCPAVIFCDNAKNFVGAKRKLDELGKLFSSAPFQSQVSKQAAKDGFEFKFIPPRSPNFGGLWEAAVKSLKGHMKRVIGTNVLLPDEMWTVVSRIQACLNSRPLTPISDDPADLDVLTPAHFLMRRPLVALPRLEDIPEGRLARWQRVQQYNQIIWKRWSTEYLSTLQSRNKWKEMKKNLCTGMMVLLKEDNVPSLRWKVGRIEEVFPGSDGIVRVVNVRTAEGVFRRGVSKICLLPIKDNADSSSEEHEN